MSSPKKKSTQETPINPKDHVDFVKYLLDGSGAETSVDYGALRRDLETMSTPFTEMSDDKSASISSSSNNRYLNFNNTISSQKEKQNDNEGSVSSLQSIKAEVELLNDSLKREGLAPFPAAGFDDNYDNFFQVFSEFSRIKNTINDLQQKAKEATDKYYAIRQEKDTLESDLNNQMRAYEDLRSKYDGIKRSVSRSASPKRETVIHDEEGYEKYTKEIEKLRKELQNLMDENKRKSLETERKFEELMKYPPKPEEKPYVDMLQTVYNLSKGDISVKTNAPVVIGQSQTSPTLEVPAQSRKASNAEGLSIIAEKLLNEKGSSSTAHKEISLLRKENERLNLELSGRPSLREWKIAQRKIKDLENEMITSEKIGSTQEFTRKLIKQDKFNYSIDNNLDTIENISTSEAVNLVKILCLKLKIDDPNTLSTTVDLLIQVIKYVPSMEAFIKEVDVLAWGNDKVIYNRASPHRLSTTIANLKRQLQIKSEFKDQQVENERDDPVVQSMIDHFRDLFDVPTLDGVYPKMNEIYVYVQETKHGLKLISGLLGLPEKASITKVLESISSTIRDQRAPDEHTIVI